MIIAIISIYDMAMILFNGKKESQHFDSFNKISLHFLKYYLAYINNNLHKNSQYYLDIWYSRNSSEYRHICSSIWSTVNWRYQIFYIISMNLVSNLHSYYCKRHVLPLTPFLSCSIWHKVFCASDIIRHVHAQWIQRHCLPGRHQPGSHEYSLPFRLKLQSE